LFRLPLYEYKCEKCGHRFEKIEPFSASATKKCPKCGAKAERQISAAGIQFKGSGWYVTDYKGKSPAGGTSESGSSSSESDSSGSSSAEAKSDSAKSGDSKTETKSESKPASKPSNEKASKRKK
jgi:putative FmdB family regulatory protein